MSILGRVDGRWTIESFDAIAGALGVRWPAWYPPFVVELAQVQHRVDEFWLAGGFIFASPARTHEETVAFRTGRAFFTGGPSWEEAGPDWPPRCLPHRYVVVGRTGEGPVLVDTSRELPMLLSLSNEGYFCGPLIDFAAVGKTPVEVARSIREAG